MLITKHILDLLVAISVLLIGVSFRKSLREKYKILQKIENHKLRIFVTTLILFVATHIVTLFVEIDTAQRYGVSKEAYKNAFKEVERKEKIINNLLEVLDEKEVDIALRDVKLHELSKKYKEQGERLTIRAKENDLVAKAEEKYKAGDWKAAENIMRQSLKRNLQAVSINKKAAAADAYAIGSLMEIQLEYGKAKSYYRQSVQLESQNTEYINSLAMILYYLRDSKEAIKNYTKALEIDLINYGDKHPNVAIRYNNLGAAWLDLGEYQMAIDYISKSLDINLGLYGDKAPIVAEEYNNIGEAWRQLGYPKKAIQKFYNKALSISIDAYGDRHPIVSVIYNNIGEAWRQLGYPRKAIQEFYNKALAISIDAYGKKHPTVAMIYNNIGTSWKMLKKYQKAKKFHGMALDIDFKIYGDKHPKVGIRYNNLGADWEGLGNNKKANEYYSKALKILMDVYGSEHPATKQVKTNIDNLIAAGTQ